MDNEKVFRMGFARVYPLLLNKAVKKGRTPEEVRTVIRWLTGYSGEDIDRLLGSDISYGDFFRNAPAMNPDREKIRGTVCGVRVESVGDPLMREIRRLDLLVDELARGKAMEKILRS